MTEGSVTMQTSVSQNDVLAPDKEKVEPKAKENACWKKFKHILRLLYTYIRSIIGLLFLLTVYSFLGAFIFRAIEGPYEQKTKEKIVTKREEIIELIVNYTNLTVHNEEHLTNKMSVLLKDYESEIYDAYKTGVVTTTSKPKWDFFSALFYSGTVYTTIGYGHIAPSTTLGQAVTIIYAFIGIPLTLITLADLGKRFTFAIKFVLAFLSQIAKTKCCRRARGDKTKDYNVEEATIGKVANGTEVRPGVKIYFGYEVDTEFNLNFFLALGIVFVYMLLGAGIYTRWEEWTYFEAVYFVFISISTIGFGDVIPAHPRFFLLSSVYVFIGLSLVSMCINVAMVFFTKQIDKAKVNIGRATERAMERTNRTITMARGKMHEMSTRMNQFHHNHSFRNHHYKNQDHHYLFHRNHHSIHNLHKPHLNGRGFKHLKRNSL